MLHFYCYSAVIDMICVNLHNVFLWDINKGLNKKCAEIRPQTAINFTRTVLLDDHVFSWGEFKTKISKKKKKKVLALPTP